eukprot:scaffold3362_cov402-Prasinococcus_capsulatus_cf.AAC.15
MQESGESTEGEAEAGPAVRPTLVRQPACLRRCVAVAAGELHTCVVTEGGELWAWGLGSSWGKACPDRDLQEEEELSSVPTLVQYTSDSSQTLQPVRSVACGARHTLFATSGGEAFTAGSVGCNECSSPIQPPQGHML